MPSEQDGVMVILSSPSGAGKTTLVNLLSKLNKFDIQIPDHQAENIATVGQAISYKKNSK